MVTQSHGSADLYPTLLSNQYNYSPNAVTVTQVVANLGAMTGGMVMGYTSEIFGRRLCIIILSFIGGILLWPYCFTSSHSVIAAAFFEQFCVQGVWVSDSFFFNRLVHTLTETRVLSHLISWNCLPAQSELS